MLFLDLNTKSKVDGNKLSKFETPDSIKIVLNYLCSENDGFFPSQIAMKQYMV
jgi:hypothetical protein